MKLIKEAFKDAITNFDPLKVVRLVLAATLGYLLACAMNGRML